MSIDDYLRACRLSAAQLAEMVRCDPSTVSTWRTGAARPSPPMLRRLMRVTRGQIGPADFPRQRRRHGHHERRAAG